MGERGAAGDSAWAGRGERHRGMDRLAGGERIGDWACMSACRDACMSTEGYMVTGDCAWAKDGLLAWMGVGL